MKAKTPSQSYTLLTDIVLPSETNSLNHMFGGELLARMDRAASIAARRHCNQIVVTASVNYVSFENPIPLDSVVSVSAKVSRAFTSSMEVVLDVIIEDPKKGTKIKTNRAIYTFVAVNDQKKPVPVPKITPETEEEKEHYIAALRRKQLSLVLAGKMQANDATELKSLFFNE